MIAVAALLLAAPVPVLWVDAQAAIQDLPETQRVAAKVAAERTRLQDNLRSLEVAYEKEAPVGPARERALAQLEAQRTQGERDLSAMEQAGLGPILNKVQAILPDGVVRLDVLPILDADPSCDRTAWLKRRLAGERLPVPAPPKNCAYVQFLELDFEAALRGSQLAQRTTKSLDLERDRRQAALAEEQRRLRLAGKGEAVLAEVYQAEQAALRRKEAEAEAALEERLLTIVSKLRRPGTLIAEKPTQTLVWWRACDLTAWAQAQLDGQSTSLPPCAQAP